MMHACAVVYMSEKTLWSWSSLCTFMWAPGSDISCQACVATPTLLKISFLDSKWHYLFLPSRNLEHHLNLYFPVSHLSSHQVIFILPVSPFTWPLECNTPWPGISGSVPCPCLSSSFPRRSLCCLFLPVTPLTGPLFQAQLRFEHLVSSTVLPSDLRLFMPRQHSSDQHTWPCWAPQSDLGHYYLSLLRVGVTGRYHCSRFKCSFLFHRTIKLWWVYGDASTLWI